MLIAVASTNAVKVAAVQAALRLLRQRARQLPLTHLVNSAKPWRVQPVTVASGVAAQPFSEEETRRGALQRARAALQASINAQLAIGLEGGVSEQAEGLYSTVWVAVVDRYNREVCVNGARFVLPPNLAKAIRSGTEMGDAMDQFTKRTGVKHAEGMIGVMTDKLTTRTREYRELSYLALSLYFSQTYQL